MMNQSCLAVVGVSLLLTAGCSSSGTVDSRPAPDAKSTPSSALAAEAESKHSDADLAQSNHQTHDVSMVSDGAPALEIFEKRILPIFRSPKPSSCAECHLSGVDLKEYILPTQRGTFASLVSAGLIDTQRPDDSKLLRFINRRTEIPGLVSDRVRQEEYQAFRAWIHAAIKDPELLAESSEAAPIGSLLPEAVIAHARKDRVLNSFIENVWTEVRRCAACHSPDRNQEQVKKHGEQVSWIKLGDPQATLTYILDAGLIDAENPEKSLLLMKPTMQVKHGGGQKMLIGDRSYKQFRSFIDDYSATIHGKYLDANQLPSPNPEVSVVSDIWLKIEGVPAEFDQLLLQVDLYRRENGKWSSYRVATSDRQVFGDGRLWQHSLSLIAPRASSAVKEIQAETLTPGEYLAKMYVDRTGKLKNDFAALLNDDDLVGSVEINSQWPAGYGRMTVVRFPAN